MSASSTSTTSTNGPKPFVGYIRISSLGAREAGNNISAERQLASIQRTAEKLGVELLRVYSDEGVSGQTFERREWPRVVDLVDSGRAGGVIVWNQARASRAKPWATLAMVDDIEAAGGEMHAEDGPITLKTLGDRITTFVQADVDNSFAVKQGEGLKESVRDAIERGAHLSAPYGYRKAPRQDGRAQPILVNEDEAPAVRVMFELRAAGKTWPGIAEELNRAGSRPRPTRRNGRPVEARWTHKTVRQIVTSRVYLGIAFNGSHEKAGAHQAIVDAKLWNKANRVKGTKPRGPREGYLLTGLVRCANCGYSMAHTSSHGLGYFACQPAQNGTPCPARTSVPEAALDAYVEEELRRFLEADDRLMRPASAHDETIAAAEAALDAAEARLRGTLAGFRDVSSDAARAMLREQVAEDEEAVVHAGRDLAAARHASRGVDFPPEVTFDAYRRRSVEERRHLLSLAFACVVVRPAVRWREPVADRARLVDQTPALAGVDLIEYVRTLDGPPAGAGVVAGE